MVLWLFACAAALVMTLLTVDYAKSSELRKAAEWHRVHGNVIIVDGHRISLPQDWWEKDEHEGGKHVIVKASVSLTKMSSTGIILDRKGVEESKRSEEEIRKTLESFVDSDKRGNGVTQSSLVVVRAAATNIYCLKTLLGGKEIELRCDVVDAPIVIKSIGPPDTEKEIEAILSTFE